MQLILKSKISGLLTFEFSFLTCISAQLLLAQVILVNINMLLIFYKVRKTSCNALAFYTEIFSIYPVAVFPSRHFCLTLMCLGWNHFYFKILHSWIIGFNLGNSHPERLPLLSWQEVLSASINFLLVSLFWQFWYYLGLWKCFCDWNCVK